MKLQKKSPREFLFSCVHKHNVQTKPVDNNYLRLAYYFIQSGGPSCNCKAVIDESETLNDLCPGTLYWITITAFTSAGPGPLSKKAFGKTRDGGNVIITMNIIKLASSF